MCKAGRHIFTCTRRRAHTYTLALEWQRVFSYRRNISVIMFSHQCNISVIMVKPQALERWYAMSGTMARSVRLAPALPHSAQVLARLCKIHARTSCPRMRQACATTSLGRHRWIAMVVDSADIAHILVFIAAFELFLSHAKMMKSSRRNGGKQCW